MHKEMDYKNNELKCKECQLKDIEIMNLKTINEQLQKKNDKLEFKLKYW